MTSPSSDIAKVLAQMLGKALRENLSDDQLERAVERIAEIVKSKTDRRVLDDYRKCQLLKAEIKSANVTAEHDNAIFRGNVLATCKDLWPDELWEAQ